MTPEDLERLAVCLLQTGPTVKPGTETESKVAGSYELISHPAWKTDTAVSAKYVNAGSFLMRTLSDDVSRTRTKDMMSDAPAIHTANRHP